MGASLTKSGKIPSKKNAPTIKSRRPVKMTCALVRQVINVGCPARTPAAFGSLEPVAQPQIYQRVSLPKGNLTVPLWRSLHSKTYGFAVTPPLNQSACLGENGLFPKPLFRFSSYRGAHKKNLIAPLGLEPRQQDPESWVLPLDDRAVH